MVVRTLDVKKDLFRPRDVDEVILGLEVPYLSAIGALMFLAGHTRHDITFSLNLLARYSSCPTRRHCLVDFAHAGYMFDPHNGRSQTGYVFTSGGTTISWHSVKQTIAENSSNHAEIMAIHKASRECVWLRNATQHIRGSYGILQRMRHQQFCMKIMQHALLNLRKVFNEAAFLKRIIGHPRGSVMDKYGMNVHIF
ncbi:hypothetical protein Tco_0530588 [Tanacetum coccineum]